MLQIQFYSWLSSLLQARVDWFTVGYLWDREANLVHCTWLLMLCKESFIESSMKLSNGFTRGYRSCKRLNQVNWFVVEWLLWFLFSRSLFQFLRVVVRVLVNRLINSWIEIDWVLNLEWFYKATWAVELILFSIIHRSTSTATD